MIVEKVVEKVVAKTDEESAVVYQNSMRVLHKTLTGCPALDARLVAWVRSKRRTLI